MGIAIRSYSAQLWGKKKQNMVPVECGLSLAPRRVGRGGCKCSLVVLEVLQGQRSMEAASEMRVWEGAGQGRSQVMWEDVRGVPSGFALGGGRTFNQPGNCHMTRRRCS